MLAHEAAFQLGLDEVLLIPTGEAPHKRIEPEPGAEVRLEMVRRAAEPATSCSTASAIEVEADGPSYSFRTLEALSEQRPGDEIHFLMGADVAAQLESWRRPERVLELARSGSPGGRARRSTRPRRRSSGSAPPTGREVVRMPELAVSSTRIRRRIARGRPVRYLVPDAVLELIAERGLYRERVTA